MPDPAPKPKTKLSPSMWRVIAALAFLISGTWIGGFGGFLMTAGVIVAVTATSALATGQKTWARIPSKRVGVIALAVAVVAALSGTAVVEAPRAEQTVQVQAAPSATPTHMPSPEPSKPAVEFTDGDPGDPDTVTTPTDPPSVAVGDTTATAMTAAALLATVPVKGKAPKTGYDRVGDFGTAWLDVDHNGCDTRNDILNRDLTQLTKSGACKVLSGTLNDPYTGKTISFLRGETTSTLVQIDHMVALSNAWQTGAQQLTQDQRISLANDPINLLAVDGPTNASKGDGDAATWLPPVKSFRCTYVAHQVSVKATYKLWMTQAEHDAIARILATCPNQPAYTSTFAPTPAPVVTPPPAPPAPAPAPAKPAPAPPAPPPAAPPSVYYANCAAVRAAGKAPLYAGQPGYSTKLDRDHDGVACE